MKVESQHWGIIRLIILTLLITGCSNIEVNPVENECKINFSLTDSTIIYKKCDDTLFIEGIKSRAELLEYEDDSKNVQIISNGQFLHLLNRINDTVYMDSISPSFDSKLFYDSIKIMTLSNNIYSIGYKHKLYIFDSELNEIHFSSNFIKNKLGDKRLGVSWFDCDAFINHDTLIVKYYLFSDIRVLPIDSIYYKKKITNN